MSEDAFRTGTGSGQEAAGPLAGTRVVEVAMWVYVPAAGVVLRDWGADVTKVESPQGDPLRTLTWGGIPPTPTGSFMWGLYNRGKRSIVLDLRQERGQTLLYELVKEADVFLVSLLPETRRAFNIDVDHIRVHNPEIVYAIGSGQGYAGPDADRGGYDGITFWYRGGVAESVSPAGEVWPLGMPVGGFGDTLSGVTLAGGIAAALARKARTGNGSVVDGSLLATSLWAMAPGVAASAIANADVTGRTGERALGRNPLSALYRTSDDRVVALGMLQPDKYWASFCDAIGHPDLAGDPRFLTAEDRAVHADACVEALDAIFSSRPLAEWRTRLARQDGQWDVAQRLSELPGDPQAIANAYAQRADVGVGGELPIIAAPVQHDRSPVLPGTAPRLGEHTDAVLADFGISPPLVDEARRDGVIA